MSLNPMVSSSTISSEAANILEKFAKNQELQEAIDCLDKVSKKVKKEVWVGALALGFSDLLYSIFSQKVVCSTSFGRTIRKFQTCFDVETDQDKIFHAIATLRKVEKVQKDIEGYSCVIEDCTFPNHILNELCRYSVRWGRIVHSCISQTDKKDVSVMEKCYQEKYSFQWLSFYPSYAKQKMEDAIEECGLHLSRESPSIALEKILDGRNSWRQQVSQEVSLILENYLFNNIFPAQNLELQIKEELWLAAFSLGQTYLMRFLFGVEDMNKPAFSALLTQVVKRVDFASPNSQWLLALLILAKAYESEFHKYNDTWLIELSFQKFLVRHKKPLAILIEVLLKELKGKELELRRPNRELERFHHKPFLSSFDERLFEISLNNVEDLGLLFKEIFISKVRFSLPKLQRFSSNPETLKELIKKSSHFITHEVALYLYELTHTKILDLKVLVNAPQGTLQAFIQAVEVLGLDLLLKSLKKEARNLGYIDITDKNKAACQEILNWAKPEKLFIARLGWLELIESEVTKSLHLSAEKFNQIEGVEPCIGITHLNLHADEKWSPHMKTLEKVFPNAVNIAFEYGVQFHSPLPSHVKNVVIEGCFWGNLYDANALIGLNHLSSVQRLALNCGNSTLRVKEEDDVGSQVFDQLAQLPKLSILYLRLPQDVKPEAFTPFKESALKKLYVDRDEKEIQAIVGSHMQVKKGNYSAFKDFYSQEKM